MSSQRILTTVLMLVFATGCGDDDSPSTCPDGLVVEGDRCIAFDGGLPDGCLSEELCNGIDDDCDGTIDEDLRATTFYADADGDGAGDPVVMCEACDVSVCDTSEVGAWVAERNDCDDTCPTCFPGAPELCDALDNDCDALTDEAASNTYYADVDGDGYGVTEQACAACDPSECDALDAGTWVELPGDCDDTCTTCSPEGTEVCDGLDNSCDGVVDEGVLITFYADADGDSHGDSSMPCQACDPSGCGMGDWVTVDDDCDDTCETCFPGGTEVCDERDNDCSGVADSGLLNVHYRDGDRDGYGVPGPTRVFCGDEPPLGWAPNDRDCADGDARAFPGARTFYADPILGTSPPGGPNDYNCSGEEELEPPALNACGSLTCNDNVFETNSRPCTLDSRFCGNNYRRWSCNCGLGGCSSSTTIRLQACR